MRTRTLINGFIFISSIFLINNSSAETVSLEYKGFYDRLKQVNKQNYPLVELAFSVPITPDCTIVSGSITTENDQYPLTYSKQQRLFIPYDPQLKSDRGLVNIKVAGEAKQCAIAMQVRAKETKQGFTQTELLALTEDMNKLLDGLSFEFTDMQNQTVKVVIDDVETIAKEKYTLTVEQINQLKQISFTQKPSIISPLVTQ